MPTMQLIINIALMLVALVCINARPQECQSGPFRYPEMYFDYHSCSTVFDWSRSIPDGCRDDLVSFDVQFSKDCNTRTFSTVEEDLYRGEYSPGQCLADDDCYARVRGRLRDPGSSPTRYTTWTGLSHTYRMFYACVKEGNDICLPIQKCSGVLPTFLVNGEVYFPRSVNDINNGKICLRRVNNHIHFLEVCHKKSLFCSSYKDEFVISKRGQIEVTTDTCSGCYNQCGLETNSEFARNNHCVAIDWKMFDSTSNTLRNVCVSTQSSLQNQSSSMLQYSLQLINSSGPASTQPACDEYSDIIIHNESHSFSSADREERGIMICSDSEPPLNPSLSSNTSDIGTTRCAPSNDDSRLEAYIIALIVISSIIIIIFIVIISMIIYIVYYLHGFRYEMYVLPNFN